MIGAYTIIAYLAQRLPIAAGCSLIILLYMRIKLDLKADKKDLDDLRSEVKTDFSSMKNEVIDVLKDKLDSSTEIMSTTMDKINSIVEVKIVALEKQIKNLEDRVE